MNKSYKIIPAEIKSQILADLAIPGYEVTKLAKIYNISTTSIYNLQKVAQAMKSISDPNLAHNFTLLSIKDSVNSRLTKASLTFSTLSFALEGDIKSSTLVSIIKILEEQSC
jgi:transposase-like protein